MKIFMATPTRDLERAHPEYVRARDSLLKNGLALPKDYQLAYRYVEGLSILSQARALITSLCLASGADYIFMVDDDIFFRPEDLRAAVLSGLPIVGLPCLLREEPRADGEDAMEARGQ